MFYHVVVHDKLITHRPDILNYIDIVRVSTERKWVLKKKTKQSFVKKGNFFAKNCEKFAWICFAKECNFSHMFSIGMRKISLGTLSAHDNIYKRETNGITLNRGIAILLL